MDYFNNVFTTFLGLESGNNIAVIWGVRKLLISCSFLGSTIHVGQTITMVKLDMYFWTLQQTEYDIML